MLTFLPFSACLIFFSLILSHELSDGQVARHSSSLSKLFRLPPQPP